MIQVDVRFFESSCDGERNGTKGMKFVRGSTNPCSRYTAPRMQQIQGPATAIIIDGQLQQSQKLLKAPCPASNIC